MYAAAKVGAILVPLNPSYKELELRHVLQHSSPKMLVAAASCKGVDMVHTVQAATCHMLSSGSQQGNHTLEHLLVLNSPSSGRIVYMHQC